ncbi:hypothetical protein YW3DRAFT_04183 [Streptomyces sp. MnatMP-M77]|nr:hypothetical protein YW3DRAFT_04183 [Streptomyces sp. MnatMP-M77]
MTTYHDTTIFIRKHRLAQIRRHQNENQRRREVGMAQCFLAAR